MFCKGSSSDNFVDFKYCGDDSSGFGYGMIAFGYSPDGEEVDCKIVLYRMKFKVAPQQEIKHHSKLFGLIKWTTSENKPHSLGSDQIQAFENYFRLKALQGFYNEGFIDKINYVPSLN